MSYTRWRRLQPLILAIALLAFAPYAGAAITPQSDVLLPWFEIDLQRHEIGLATTFSVVNASPTAVNTRFIIYSNWGIPILEVPMAFNRTEAKSIDLTEWLVHGKLPDRTLSPAELAHVQAALTGQKSPSDGLYYGTPSEEGYAIGYVIAQTLGNRPDTLFGDTYDIDLSANFFDAETLHALTHDLRADCERHGIRFVNAGRLYEGAELIVWSGRKFSPSATPNPVGAKMKVTLSVYDQSGHHVQDCHRELLAVDTIKVCHLDITPPVGWLDIKTEDPTIIIEHLHSTTQTSAELHSYCLMQNLTLDGPKITLEKRINGAHTERATAPRFVLGQEVKFEYVVTNSGTVALSPVVVTDDKVEVTCPQSSLSPGESMTCTARTAANGCVNLNIATATGTAPDGATATATDFGFYEGMYSPGLTVKLAVNGEEADVPTGPEVEAGDTLTWTFVVTNTGDAPISQIVTGTTEGAATCPKTDLEPGQSMTCTAQSLALPGQQKEIATANGIDPCGNPISATDPAHYFGRKSPSILIKKFIGENDADTTPGPMIPVGTTIEWRYIVTNTGNMTLSDIVVTDDDGVTPVCPKNTLEPGESMTCTASSIALPCDHLNTATVTAAITHDERKVVDQDPANYFGTSQPSIDITKNRAFTLLAAVVGPAYIHTGTVLQWRLTVVNTGDVALTGVTVTDPQAGEVQCPKTGLAAGESMVCTASSTALAGQQENVAYVTAQPPCGEAVSDSAVYPYIGITPAITLEKLINQQEADDPQLPVRIPAGETIVWTFLVTNTGDVTLDPVTVTDLKVPALTCPKTSLAPGESMTCTGPGTALSGLQCNTGEASGESPVATVTASDSACYFGLTPSISIVKSTNGLDANEAPGPEIFVGATVTWTYLVTNTGDLKLTNIIVQDNKGVAVTCPKTVLEPAESMTCTGSGIATLGQYSNIGKAGGLPPGGPPGVTDTDPSHYFGVQPPPAAISIEKLTNGQDADTPPGPSIPAGQTVNWTYVVTNVGVAALSNVAVTDNMGVTVTCPKTTLASGESMTCTASGTAVTGQYANIGTATGEPPDGRDPVTASDPSHYFGELVGNQGCTPGYWKNHTGSWPPTGYSTSQTVVSVFGEAYRYPAIGNSTLLVSLGFSGGSGNEGAAEILIRAATAALLNAAHPGVAYPRMPAAVVADVNTALATNSRDSMLALAAALDADNNLGCPLH